MAAVPLEPESLPTAVYNLSFPPFPHKTGNHTLIPFAEFEPKGLRISDDLGDNGFPVDEVDGDAIPTIALGVKHELDKKKKKSSRPRTVAADGTIVPRAWFELWEDHEPSMRAERLDPNTTSAYDCFVQADIDFQHGRFMPLQVQTLYDEWRVFVGLLPDRRKKPSSFNRRRPEQTEDQSNEAAPSSDPVESDSTPIVQAEEETFSDDADEGDDEAELEAQPAAPAQSRPSGYNPFDGVKGEYEGNLEPLPERSDTFSIAYRFEQFISDPLLATKCFLSHEFRNRSLYYLTWNLHAGPIVVAAFLDFLLRHRLLADEIHVDLKNLRHAAEFAHLARTELPKIKETSGALRDGWGRVCNELWGDRMDVHERHGLPEDDLLPAVPGLAEDEGYITEVGDAPEAQLVDLTDRFDEVTTQEASAGWGDDSPEIHATWEPITPDPTLFSYAGCASFPLTHEPVRAEYSVRQIIAVIPPTDPLAFPAAKNVSTLHTQLGMLILAPWKSENGLALSGCGKSGIEREISGAEMLNVEGPIAVNGVLHDNKAAEFFREDESGYTHDPSHDIIAAFVDPEALQHCHVGVGVGGIFVQVAKRLDANELYPFTPGTGNNVKKGYQGKNPKPANTTTSSTTPVTPATAVVPTKDFTPPTYGNPKDGRSWWYIDKVEQTIPSYWTDVADLPVVVV